MKKYSPLALLLAIFLAFNTQSHFAQGELMDVPFAQQIQESDLVVEGKVIVSQSNWNSTNDYIYTTHTIEVYKVFKGEAVSTVELVTPGGTVGLDAIRVVPSLGLSKGQMGVFLLEATSVNLSGRTPTGLNQYRAYSSVQGFYSYDLQTNRVANPFRAFEGITSRFYSELQGLTNSGFIQVADNNLELPGSGSNRGMAVVISNISSSTVTAGTATVLTINGSGFGAGQGTVEFSNADDGGATRIPPLPSQIISWGDTQIIVEVPGNSDQNGSGTAGTGVVRVTHQFDTTFDEENITVSYSESNVESDAVTATVFIAYPTQHVDNNTSGGYTFRYFTDFNADSNATDSFERALDTWRCETSINLIVGAVTSTDVAASDGVNVVRLDNGAELPNGVLGRATSYYSGCFIMGGSSIAWFVNELDIVFNDTTNWQYGPALAISPQVDFESVAVHELGHAHQLGHVNDTNAIMHYAISPGENIRTLTANDIAGGNDVHSRSLTFTSCSQSSMTNYSGSCPPPLALSEAELDASIALYPNPTNGLMYLEAGAGINLEKFSLYDLHGRLVSEQSFTGNQVIRTLDLDALSSGLYFATIQAEQGSVTKKIVVQ